MQQKFNESHTRPETEARNILTHYFDHRDFFGQWKNRLQNNHCLKTCCLCLQLIGNQLYTLTKHTLKIKKYISIETINVDLSQTMCHCLKCGYVLIHWRFWFPTLYKCKQFKMKFKTKNCIDLPKLPYQYNNQSEIWQSGYYFLPNLGIELYKIQIKATHTCLQKRKST